MIFHQSLAKVKRGFTLIELLVVMGIIAILVAVVAIAVNPGRQFAQARDTQRRADLTGIISAVYQYAAENNGNLPGGITTTVQDAGTTGANLAGDLVPTYMSAIPFDPSTGSPATTGYQISTDANNRVTASASGEIAAFISISR